ncbi:MAG TPA: GtrA family protein [Candidatus Andersenbacteria bacterium]|nr:GtrA family protein [Candidatus Andersenbacteria bacterium]
MQEALFQDRVLQILPEQYRNVAKQFVKFGITGAIGAVVDFSTFGFLTRIVGWHTTYALLGTEIIAANNVSVFLAICSNFIINRYWTFKDVSGSAAKQGAGYFLLNLCTWALNQILVSLFVFHVPLLNQLFGAQRDLVAKALAIGIILFVNFFGSKLFIFRHSKQG